MAAKMTSKKGANKSEIDSHLDMMKGNIRDVHQYFKPNYDRFNYFRKFIYQTSLTAGEISVLQELGKPILEFNILEAYISRQCGEFADQEPSFIVSPADDARNIDPRLPEFIESHMRAIMFNSNIDNMEYEVFRDILSGGFSAMEVYTDYASENSFDQNIYVKRVFDPTLVGFDKIAKESHKGDGNFCFQLYPMSREEFEEKYGDEYTRSMKFNRDIEGFRWSYTSDSTDIVLMADYYYKKRKKVKIVKLRTGEVMTEKDYNKLIDNWNAISIEQPPVAVKSRETEIITISRNRLIENSVLEEVDTDYKYLPLVFVDGNSVMIRDYAQGSAQQVTRPYVYHGEGIQKLKNFAGMTIANDIENLVQHKWSIQKEAIPAEYKDAYIDPQKAQVMVWNGFKQDDQSVALQGPQPVPRVPLPPEVTNAFSMSDQTLQSILGSYDAALGINNNQLSGKAINNGAMQSNSAAKPFRVGYIRALNQVGRIIVDLMPKYYVDERSLPIKDIRGDMSQTMVNIGGAISTKYTPESLNLKVESGVNFEVQKQVSLQMLTSLMQASPAFAAYMGTAEGLQFLLDNVTLKNVEAVKQGVAQFSQKMEAQQKQQQQMEMQMNPVVVKMKELQQKSDQNRTENILDAARVETEKQDSDTDRILALAKIGQMTDQGTLERDKVTAENARTAADMAMSTIDMHHGHFMDAANLHSENARHQQSLENKQTK